MANEDAAPVALSLDAAALMTLAHPLRFKLWELLDEHGQATVTELAKLAGAGVEETSGYLSELSGHGLVEKVESKWRRRSGAFTFQPHQFENDPDTARAAHFLETELIRMHTERLHRWLAVSRTMPLQWREVSYDGSITMRLTRDELAELGERVIDVIMDYRTRDREGEPAARVEVFFHAFPIELE